MKKLLIPFLFALAIVSCKKEEPKKEAIAVNYPETKKVDTVDTYFGTDVKDPYRWLEDDMSDETADWVQSENKVTFGYLENIPFRDALKRTVVRPLEL